MKTENKVHAPWTAAHQTILSRLLNGLDSIGAQYNIQVGGSSYGELIVQNRKTRTRVNDFVAKYDYIKKISQFSGGTMELVAEPGEAEKLRAVSLSALARQFDAGNYTTTVEGDLITIVAYGRKNVDKINSNQQGGFTNV